MLTDLGFNGNFSGSGTIQMYVGMSRGTWLTLELQPVPEPSTVLLIASGIVPLSLRRRH